MGYDALACPPSNMPSTSGVHPAISTDQNIATFRRQLDNIGFCYDSGPGDPHQQSILLQMDTVGISAIIPQFY